MKLENIFIELRTEFQNYHNGLLNKKRQIAPDFNAFEILYALELPFSRMIGEFLNPSGTHSQGRIFLDLFIETFFQSDVVLKKIQKVNLKLEHAIDNGRIDILIDFDGKFGVAIENKPYANDQDKQIMRYCEYLSSTYGNTNFMMLYLSADGSDPTNVSLTKEEREKLGKQFKSISYSQLRMWFLEYAKETKKIEAERLTTLILEFAEYINKQFCGTNSLKNNMIGETIERNILEAYEINSLWNEHKPQFETLWEDKINFLVNKELPRLVYENLVSKSIIDDEWEYIEGKFDIRKKHLEGFKLKKKLWKHYSLVISSTKHEKTKGTQKFFPMIGANINIEPANKEQTINYNNITESAPETNWNGGSGKVFWSAEFPDSNYSIWNYENWSDIINNGKTIEYVSDYLGKLVSACQTDIDILENRLQNTSQYTESDFRNFINQFQWIYAKTYAQKSPHEYVVLEKVGLNYKDEFIKIAQFIRDKGFKALYYKREGFYYRIDENYYWTMDEKAEDTDLINRAKWDDYELIDNSWNWKGNKSE